MMQTCRYGNEKEKRLRDVHREKEKRIKDVDMEKANR